MKDSIRIDLKKLCYHIIENKEPEALAEQLTQVQMLYERLLVINYLNEQNEEAEKSAQNIQTQTLAATGAGLKSEKPDIEEPLAIAPKSARPIPPANVKPNEIKSDQPTATPREPAENEPKESAFEKTNNEFTSPTVNPKTSKKVEREALKTQSSLNDKLGQGNIEIGLNDRIAFVNHLFTGSQEDFNRVLSQLNTFNSAQEADEFLDQMVKPDYDWENKEEYVERLVDLVRKKLGEGANS